MSSGIVKAKRKENDALDKGSRPLFFSLLCQH